MQSIYERYLISPVTCRALWLGEDGRLQNEEESFAVVEGVPILLPPDTVADWQRELIEVVLWEHSDQIEKLYQDMTAADGADSLAICVERILQLVGEKADILQAMKRYERAETARWIVDRQETIDEESIAKFHRLSDPAIGKKRVENQHLYRGEGSLYNMFSRMVTDDHPQCILELATGAGGSTAAVALKKDKEAVLFSVDIDIACLGNVVGIGSYLGCRDTLLPVCANFWYLPFGDGELDVVCTVCGLDESREIHRTIAQVARVLKPGGRFVCVSREHAFLRQGAILEPLGFTKEETLSWLRRCRMYSDVEMLKEICAESGLTCVRQVSKTGAGDISFVVTLFKKRIS